MNPHYYLMKNKKILRLEADTKFEELPLIIRERVLDPQDILGLDQNQANWRVVIFRDEILEYHEFLEWLQTPEAFHPEEEELEYELIAN